MKTPTTLVVLRDLALFAGGVALSALVAHELADGTRLRPSAGPALPDVAHGWLCTVARYGEHRPQRVRPATGAEATASGASRDAGHGGYFGLTDAGEIVTPTDARYLAGAGRWTEAHRQIDLVFVHGAGAAEELLAEADQALTGEAPCTCGPSAGADPWCPAHTPTEEDLADDTAAPTV